MEKKKTKGFYITLLIVTLCLALIITASIFVIMNRQKEPEQWVLHSYGKNVALYNGDEVVEVYGSILIDNLPPDDKKLLDNGIAFMTKNEAIKAIEDYDG